MCGGRMVSSPRAGVKPSSRRVDGAACLGDGSVGEGTASGRELVVPAGRPLLAVGHGLALPPRPDQTLGIEPPQDRIDGAARQAGGGHDVEAVVMAVEQRLQHQGRGIGRAHRVLRLKSTYVEHVESFPPWLLETRRRFMAHFASIGLGTTLAPGVLWARMQDAGDADASRWRWSPTR